MKTFHGKVSMTFKVVVPDTFIKDMREASTFDDAKFLKRAAELHPVNDEAFIQMILSNGIRIASRQGLLALLSEGVGGTVAPASIELLGVPQDFDTDVQPVVLDYTPKSNKESEVTVRPD